MKVRLSRLMVIGESTCGAGEIVDIDANHALQLILERQAEVVEDEAETAALDSYDVADCHMRRRTWR